MDIAHRPTQCAAAELLGPRYTENTAEYTTKEVADWFRGRCSAEVDAGSIVFAATIAPISQASFAMCPFGAVGFENYDHMIVASARDLSWNGNQVDFIDLETTAMGGGIVYRVSCHGTLYTFYRCDDGGWWGNRWEAADWAAEIAEWESELATTTSE